MNGSINAHVHAHAHRKSSRIRVVWMSLGFAFLFVGFNVPQFLLTTLFPTLGFASLGIIYGLFAVSAVFLAGPVIERITAKYAIGIGALLYVLFIFSIPMESDFFFLLASVGVGFGKYKEKTKRKKKTNNYFLIGAGFIWIGQGTWLAESTASDEIGTMTGLFFGIFSVVKIHFFCFFLFTIVFFFFFFTIIILESDHWKFDFIGYSSIYGNIHDDFHYGCCQFFRINSHSDCSKIEDGFYR